MDIPEIMPAAGHLKTVEAIARIAREPNICEIRAGSFSVLRRDGNPAPNFVEVDPGSYVNALGLPNGGLPYLEENITEMQKAAGDKPLTLGIVPIGEGDLAQLTNFCVNAGVAAVELNLGCPNVWDGGVNKKLISTDPAATERALGEVAPFRGKLKIAVKLSPLFRHTMSKIVALCHNMGVDEIVTMNTRPGQTVENPDGKNGLSVPAGGLSGNLIHHEAVQQTAWTRHDIDALGSNMRLVGVGGICSGETLKNFLEAGADACQIGSHFFWSDNPRIFGEILGEYADLVS